MKSLALTRPPAPSAVTLYVINMSFEMVLNILASVTVEFHFVKFSISSNFFSRSWGLTFTMAMQSQILRPSAPLLLLITRSLSLFSSSHPSSSIISRDLSKMQKEWILTKWKFMNTQSFRNYIFHILTHPSMHRNKLEVILL